LNAHDHISCVVLLTAITNINLRTGLISNQLCPEYMNIWWLIVGKFNATE